MNQIKYYRVIFRTSPKKEIDIVIQKPRCVEIGEKDSLVDNLQIGKDTPLVKYFNDYLVEIKKKKEVKSTITVGSNRYDEEKGSLSFGGQFTLSFMKTLRVPDDGKNYHLPPSLGGFPILKVSDFKSSVPPRWLKFGGIFIPMLQREAMWLNFTPQNDRGFAVKIAVGMINVITGYPYIDSLSSSPQDYLVCPPQPWLDGINVGDNNVRQFVSVPLGKGYTLESQITGEDNFGGMQIEVIPKLDDDVTFSLLDMMDPDQKFEISQTPSELGLTPGTKIFMSCKRFPRSSATMEDFEIKDGNVLEIDPDFIHLFVRTISDTVKITVKKDAYMDDIKRLIQDRLGVPPDHQRLLFGGKQLSDGDSIAEYRIDHESTLHLFLRLTGGGGNIIDKRERGFGAGGKIKQKIYKDPSSIRMYDLGRAMKVFVHCINSEGFQQITGYKLAETNITKALYKASKIPWFSLYDENFEASSSSSPVLKGVKSVEEIDQENNLHNDEDVSAPAGVIVPLKLEDIGVVSNF